MPKKIKQEFNKKHKEADRINENSEIISNDIKVSAIKENNEEKENMEFFLKYMPSAVAEDFTFAKVNWGAGKGPYILAFRNSCDADYCSCNANEFKSIKDSDIKQNHIHIWECGSKTPEQINKLPTLEVNKWKELQKTNKQKKLEEKQKNKEEIRKLKEEILNGEDRSDGIL
jgi:hypothetical protein